MKFTDGYWLKRRGWDVKHPRHIQRLERNGAVVRAIATTKPLSFKGAELDSSQLTINIEAVAEGVIRVRLEHFRGVLDLGPHFAINMDNSAGAIEVDDERLSASVSSGCLRATLRGANDFDLTFDVLGQPATSSILRSMGIAVSPDGEKFIHEQLTIQPGESIYGLGERFGPVVKNGQVVDMWNADGGTASEQAYKNVPFYLSSRGYGVFVNHPEKVSFEVGSEVNTRVQFSVPGEYLEYYVIAGPTPKDVLRRYTKLTGRSPQVPAWSYGLWLSTSFTTDYSEDTVNSFVDKMEELDLPLRVLHFDCYWMRPSHWCDFTWDPKMFPHPTQMLTRYRERGLKVCVWINPYIAQQSHLFDEGVANGYLLKNPDGSVRQWDHWQSGMAWVDFTNPEARAWYQRELERLLDEGVDCFKTDFGERVPTDVVWHDGSDPVKMHNYYTHLYNEAVFDVLKRKRGEGEALVFARSATVGGQKFPVHWGGDSEPTFVSMAETLRGGLSLSMSGFGYWSHDMGGFEGKPNPDVFIRWFPFGMLSSHSRLHGSNSYRVPWIYGEEAVTTARRFIALKHRLMPYLAGVAQEVTERGTPIMRHMILENPADRGSQHVDTQYYFGPSLIVAPVFSESGEVDYYLPTDGFTHLLDGRRLQRAGWYRESHSYDSLPVLVPDGHVIPLGADASVPDYEWSQGLCLYLFQPREGVVVVCVPVAAGGSRTFIVEREGRRVRVSDDWDSSDWSVCLVTDEQVDEIVNGHEISEQFCQEVAAGRRIAPAGGSHNIEFTLTSV